MSAIADALVYAVTYIDTRDDESEELLEDDADALESIAGCLADASDEELDALAAAAERALAAEVAMPRPREDFVESYATWMEDMFGDDEWVGNRRVTQG